MKKMFLSDLARFPCVPANLCSLSWQWQDGNQTDYRNAGRRQNLIFYQAAGVREYHPEGREPLLMPEGSMLFIPDGAKYLTRALLPAGQTGVGINVMFDLLDSAGEPVSILDAFVIRPSDGVLSRRLDECLNACPARPLLASGCLFSLLDAFLQENRPDSHASLLSPALRRLQESPGEEQSVAELAALCHLSESTFRRHFHAETGLSPVQYRNLLRVRRAHILYEELHLSAESIASQLGFCDASHLRRTCLVLTGRPLGDPKTTHGGKKHD